MLERLKEQVWKANQELVRRQLALYTWGNVSGIDREQGAIVIKPSGVEYAALRPSQLSVVSLDGKPLEGLKPSSDTPTHLALYRAWEQIGGISHTHSKYATSWAQACRDLPCLGTTHADHFYGDVPCTGCMSAEEIETDYEANTGVCILRRFEAINPLQVPGVLVANHAPFTWGKTVEEAVENSVILEEVAFMALQTLALNPEAVSITPHLLDKHFLRKHGANAYYGQEQNEE